VVRYTCYSSAAFSLRYLAQGTSGVENYAGWLSTAIFQIYGAFISADGG